MEYNNNNNNNNNNNVSNNSHDNTLRPVGYFYTTTVAISPTYIDRLLSLNNSQNNSQNNLMGIPESSPLSNPYYEQEYVQEHPQNYNYNIVIPNSSSSSNTNLYYNSILFNSSNFELYNTTVNNEETYNNLSNAFFPTVNFIERIFNDYIENKNKLNDEEYKKNIEKIHKILEECPVCFTSSETTIKIKKCNHLFCEDCIQKWLKSHKNTCPICRVNVIMESENSNEQNSNE